MEFYNANSFVSSFSSYVFDVVAVPGTNLYAASASNHKIKLYDNSTFQLQAEYSGHTGTIQQIYTNPNLPSLIYSCSSDSSVRCWDIRSPNPQVKEFTHEKQEYFSVAVGGSDLNTVVASTESSITFWDIRDGYYYKQYSESHSEEITQVHFHPNNPSTLFSASIDGLVCIFDINKKSEEDAFVDTFSIDHAISKIGFYGLQNDHLYVITTDERLSLWDISSGVCERDFGDVRELLGADYQLDYMITCYYHPIQQKLILFGGSNEGDIHLIDINPSQFQHITSLRSGHVDVVRTILWNNSTNQIISGGEDARVCCWNAGSPPIQEESNSSEIPQSNNIILSEQREKRHDVRKISSPY